jgi:hypothetical protein
MSRLLAILACIIMALAALFPAESAEKGPAENQNFLTAASPAQPDSLICSSRTQSPDRSSR